MSLDTYNGLWRKVLLRCPSAGQFLARDWINNAFRRVVERRAWSWLIKKDQFLTATAYSTGTVSVTHNSTAVTGTGTAWTSSHEGRQFVVSGAPVYTVTTVTDATHIVLDDEYGGDTDTSATYSIHTAYVNPPTDFHSFISLWDAENSFVLNTVTTQRELNAWDPERTNTGDAYHCVFRDYYTQSGQTIATPRYELWPHQTTQHAYPFLYESRPSDLEDTSATLPRFLHGDLLVEMALEQAALWPGPTESPNPYFNRDLARHHASRAEQLIQELERQDEEVSVSNVMYPPDEGGIVGDGDFLQSHAI